MIDVCVYVSLWFAMIEVLTPFDIEHRAAELGLKMAEVCRRAKANTSTWQRWKKGQFTPNLATYNSIIDVLNQQEAHGQN